MKLFLIAVGSLMIFGCAHSAPGSRKPAGDDSVLSSAGSYFIGFQISGPGRPEEEPPKAPQTMPGGTSVCYPCNTSKICFSTSKHARKGVSYDFRNHFRVSSIGASQDGEQSVLEIPTHSCDDQGFETSTDVQTLKFYSPVRADKISWNDIGQCLNANGIAFKLEEVKVSVEPATFKDPGAPAVREQGI